MANVQSLESRDILQNLEFVEIYNSICYEHMTQPTIESIDQNQLNSEQKHALDILINLSFDRLNRLKELMNLGSPGVIGQDTLNTFAQLCQERGLDLSNNGVNTFKDQHKLDNTGALRGVIGPTTAKVYFDEITAKKVWCPLATKDAAQANDAGAFKGGPPRGVLHTTEGMTFTSVRSAFVIFH